MEIRSKEVRIIPVDEIKPNPKNRNQHSAEQIEHLVKQFQYQGFRVPLIVSNRSGMLVAGHGRLQAAIKAGATELPVVYQDFDSDEAEYAFGIAENATQSWSELDLSGINSDLGDLGPDFNLDLLGIKDFNLDAATREILGSEELMPEDFESFNHTCPRCGFEFDSSKKEEGSDPRATDA